MTTGMFSLKATTVRVWCDIETEQGERPYDGLRVDVRRNLTNGELHEFRETARQIDERGTAITEARQQANAAFRAAMAEAEGDDARQAELINAETAALTAYVDDIQQVLVDRFEAIAPYILGWNLGDPGDGDVADAVPVPPPCEIGTAALAYLTNELVNWLLRVTMQAYRLGFPIGSRTSSGPEPRTPAPNDAKPTASGSRSRRSRAKSSSPAA